MKLNVIIILGHFQERPKSAVFPTEVKSKMSIEEQNERIRRNQSSSVRDKRRSLNLSNNQNLDGLKPSVNYRVVSISFTLHHYPLFRWTVVYQASKLHKTLDPCYIKFFYVVCLFTGHHGDQIIMSAVVFLRSQFLG